MRKSVKDIVKDLRQNTVHHYVLLIVQRDTLFGEFLHFGQTPLTESLCK